MIIHTKEKAKIHSHEPKGARIKGSNIYTVECGPKSRYIRKHQKEEKNIIFKKKTNPRA